MLPLIKEVYTKVKMYSRYADRIVELHDDIEKEIKEIEKGLECYDELINTIYSKSKIQFAKIMWDIIKYSENIYCRDICWAGMYDEKYAIKCYEECRYVPLEMYKEAKKEFEEAVKKLKEAIK